MTNSNRLDETDVCEECGAAVAGGKAGCRVLFDEVLAREWGDYRYARLHRLTVDAYSLQHPREYMRSGKSFVAHLTGMYAALEADERWTATNQAVQRWLNGPRVIKKSNPPPRRRGELTIAHLHQAADADEHRRRVQEWARSAWEAWSDLHGLAKHWIHLATSESPPG